VVAHAALPALAGLPPAGQILLPDVTVPAVRSAIESLFRPGVAEQLQAEAAGLALPTWRDYAREVASWASA
jgi:hypothetical protein